MAPQGAVARTVSIVADDLTGATDSVLQFQRAGWAAYMLLAATPPAEVADRHQPVATSRSLDTRALPDPDAAERTCQAVDEQLSMDIERLYVKIDSTVRGSVAGQVRGALEAWSTRHRDALAIVCPAYPQMGRVIRGGRMWVNEKPLNQSPAAYDPVTPVTTSDLGELFPGAVSVACGDDVERLAHRLAEVAQASRVAVVDAADDADLRRLAEAAELLGTRAMCVGSAGFARHLARVWHPGGPAATPTDAATVEEGRVVVCISSLSEVSARQAEHLRDHLGERVVHHELAASELADAQLRQRWQQPGLTEAAPVLLLRPSEDWADGDRVAAARTVARGLAAAVGGLVDTGRVSGLVLVGGDGAEATLELLGAGALRVVRQVSEGVPLSRVVGGPAQDLAVATKAGGFGTTTTLTDIVSAMLDHKEA